MNAPLIKNNTPTTLSHTSHRWHDPLRLIQQEAPSRVGRIILWIVCGFVFLLICWAIWGKLDIIVSAEGKLVPQTLLKIVQPAESGVIKEILVHEGEKVRAGQVLAKLDTTMSNADKSSVQQELANQRMQVRRIVAQLSGQAMPSQPNDDPLLYAQVHAQYTAQRKAFQDNLEQERSLLMKAEQEAKSAKQVLSKLEETLPSYDKAAATYKKLQQAGFFSTLAAEDKQREALEKAKDLAAQESAVTALIANIAAQRQNVDKVKSNYHSELQKELTDIRSKIVQLELNLDKSIYKKDLMELKAPQDGIIKDVATTTVGAVVQPGSVLITLVPHSEKLFADVTIKNEDVGFVRVGQTAQIKLAAYPFQKYGMVRGKVIWISADAMEVNPATPNIQRSNANTNNMTDNNQTGGNHASYKARIQLDGQSLIDPQKNALTMTSGMQIVAEINQGKRSVLEYLLSPVQKVLQEAGHER